jgi:site-specific recombinase XerD
MSGNDESSQRATSRRRQRGIFERPRGSGIWWACYFDEHGRRHRERVGPKGLARQVYAKRKTEVAERRFFPERIRRREVLLAEGIDDYLARVKGRMRSYDDWERYGRCWKAALPGKALREITPGHVERYAARRRAEGLADASINRELTFLRCVFNAAIADEKTDTNPVLRKFFAKENNQRVRYLTDEEEPRLHQEMGDEEWPKVAVAMNTGLRQGNQFHLRWTEVNFDTGLITVKRSKSGETYHVPMNDEVRAILRGMASRLRSEWVFPSETGNTPLDAKNYLHRVFLPAVKRAGIRGFRWHDLRHTFASRLVMKGVDLRTVQELMGHKTIAMTLRYAHLSPAHRLDAVQRLNRPRSATTTATEEAPAHIAVARGGEVVDLRDELDAPGRNRTCDPLLRRQVLFPLSYEGGPARSRT